MKPRHWKKSAALFVGLSAIRVLDLSAQAAPNSEVKPSLHHANGPIFAQTARGGTNDKLAFDLQLLLRQYSRGRGGAPSSLPEMSAQTVERRYGISADDFNPNVTVAIQTDGSKTVEDDLKNAGAQIQSRVGDMFYANAPVLSLSRLSAIDGVQTVSPLRAPQIPQRPAERRAPDGLQLLRSRGALANTFDHQGLTGKGVILGVIDSGIDWQHGDFRNADGTTRILALYDMSDNSWTTSGGKIGTKPPLLDGAKPLGTFYTQGQINAALKGTGKLNSVDKVGHGTACAGTAAGNGQATANGVPLGFYQGVAPAADLIIVRAAAPEGEGILPQGYLAAGWIAQMAKSRHQPCVISMSFGDQGSSHEGDSPEENFLNSLVGTGKPGVVACIAAGNEGQENLHARGRFGPDQSDEADTFSESIELFTSDPDGTLLKGYFSTEDNWGMAIEGLDNFLVDAKGQPVSVLVQRNARGLGARLSAIPAKPADFGRYFSNNFAVEKVSATSDGLSVLLPPGKYKVYGYGASPKVTNGRFDLYLENYAHASFGKGSESLYIVGSPGNAANAITVGAYDFRNTWTNSNGKPTVYNLQMGAISNYSSAGFRRDGVVKPDLIAPATYTISPLAPNSEMNFDADNKPDSTMITRDGKHLAWAGTSAACPYTAGVVALMLQKNPSLDAAQIKDILTRTARHDRFTGSVPNPNAGYGKIDPAAALRLTPIANKPLVVTTSSTRKVAPMVPAKAKPTPDAMLMPQDVLAYEEARHLGDHHEAWHAVRRWDLAEKSDIQWMQQQGWKRAALQEGMTGDGLAFLAMHRVMVEDMRDRFPQYAELFSGWATPPTDPRDKINPLAVKVSTNFDPAMLKAIDRIENHPETFADDDAFGLFLETNHRPLFGKPDNKASDFSAGLHAYLHRRFSDASSAIDMGDFTVNIENREFWRLHGWVDEQWSAFRRAKGLTARDPEYRAAMQKAYAEMHPRKTVGASRGGASGEMAMMGMHREPMPQSLRKIFERME